jgi:single-strand DNA-binding protein
MLNRICLVGRLTKDPELRYTGNGTPVCNFRIACERNYTNRDGDRDVDFINIVTWRGLAENCARHLGKGRLVGVDGSLQIRKSENNNRTYINPEVKADNVRFLDFANNNNQEKQPSVSDQHKERVEKTLKGEEQDQEFDDNFNADDFDIPF